jgi:di/tricarboxylate transporter
MQASCRVERAKSQSQCRGQQGQSQGNSKYAKRLDLGHFVSTATTPVGLIIVGAITISFFEQKRVGSCGRVRPLISELRTNNISPDRRNNLVEQVNIYKSRLASVHRDSQSVALTIVLFILTNLGSSLGLVWPQFNLFEGLVLVGMTMGVVILAFSFLMEMRDGTYIRKELDTELADFDRISYCRPGRSRICGAAVLVSTR